MIAIKAFVIMMTNHSNDPTMCLLLDTAHRKNNCITVCGKWIFDSNFEFALPLTKTLLNYICSGNDTDEITFVGVLHAIRAVPPTVVHRKLNILMQINNSYYIFNLFWKTTRGTALIACKTPTNVISSVSLPEHM